MISKRKPTHPGEVLREDVLIPLELTITEAAKRLCTSRKTLSAILNGRAPVTPDMAVKIALATSTTPESWLFMQSKLDLWHAGPKKIKVGELRAAVGA
jgi:addiction module HigA family antidote